MMIRQIRLILLGASVLAIVNIASSQQLQAQMLRKLFEGPSESQAATPKPEYRKNSEPRQPSANGQAARNGYPPATQGRSAPTNSSQRPPSRQAPSANPRTNQPQQPSRTTPSASGAAQGSRQSQSQQAQSQQAQSQQAQSQQAQSQRTQSPRTQPLGSVNRNPIASQQPRSRAVVPDNVGNGPLAPNPPFQAGPIESPKRNTPARGRLTDHDAQPSDSRASRPTEQATEIQREQNPVNPREVLNRFGFKLIEKDERLVIAQLEGNGNASSAGLRKGDSIVSVGGAPIANEKEFVEIAGMLSEGDQIELILNRDGQEEKAFIQYGQSSETPTAQEPLELVDSRRDSGWSATANESEVAKLKQIVEQQRDVIAELQERIRELESSRAKSAF